MNYHNITTDDMLNGDGLRVVLWVSGCNHHCKDCQNPETWNPRSGILFDNSAMAEIEKELKRPEISGLTISGGDPFHPSNRIMVHRIVKHVRKKYPDKTIWIYTGYLYEYLRRSKVFDNTLRQIDVLVDAQYDPTYSDVNYPWAGSINQRVIDVKRSLKEGEVVLYESH